MTANMKSCGMVKFKMDTCFFIRNKVMAIIYVEDIIFWSLNKNNIPDLEMQLREQGVDF